LAFDIIIKVSAIKDLKDLDPSNARQVINGIIKFFSIDPTKNPSLKGKFKGFYKFRVGDFRIIYTITKSQSVLIMKIAPRKNAYR